MTVLFFQIKLKYDNVCLFYFTYLKYRNMYSGMIGYMVINRSGASGLFSIPGSWPNTMHIFSGSFIVSRRWGILVAAFRYRLGWRIPVYSIPLTCIQQRLCWDSAVSFYACREKNWILVVWVRYVPERMAQYWRSIAGNLPWDCWTNFSGSLQ